ncbi:hypothetical protein [Aminobacter sp. MDW-2]|uniref:hypothetical protein n=1 Tax=Aminobacter sp. MDW-2 TaxID=2666139 RepID=UPI0012B07527|nr:hypothetical protein [Aminobacter sp. MDW-2]MRX35338.1 hypothetical protein [Aminobacter sp. MDW-2]QNH35636.1 hypothetical protein H5P29_07010 [Aminobacter sp. MDW-2]
MITFDQLIPLYRNTAFSTEESVGRLHIRDHSVLETLKLIDADDGAFRDSGITIRSSSDQLVLSGTLSVEISPPRSGLGSLARSVDGLLAAPSHRIKEPSRFYLISERFAYNDADVPDSVVKYRNTQRLIRAISEAAALVDPFQAEAIFLGPGRLRIPFLYRAADLGEVKPAVVDELEDFVFEKIHKDQKTAILASNVIELCRHQPETERFRFLLKHLRELVSKTQDGYKLFASEFSYEKIKSKTEEAINEYTNKIHKTFHDIQNQVMGVPVATVIIATQLKTATTCGVEFWANLAISIGATLFVLLLSVAVYNQLMTLGNIEGDLVRQKAKLNRDYATIADQFLSLYTKLGTRIITHRWILRLIIIACWSGVALTWWIFLRLSTLEPWACF